MAFLPRLKRLTSVEVVLRFQNQSEIVPLELVLLAGQRRPPEEVLVLSADHRAQSLQLTLLPTGTLATILGVNTAVLPLEHGSRVLNQPIESSLL